MANVKRVLIAASGTGGHLFPALYCARSLRLSLAEQNHEVEIEFVGAGRPLEEKIIDSAEFKRTVIEMVGVRHKGVKGLFSLISVLPRAFIKTWKLFTRFKPDLVVGVGGYSSVLPVLVGFMRGVPTWIHEAELKAGLANRFLSYFATKISLAFKEAEIPCKSKHVFTGHPLRPELKELPPREFSVPRNLLIMGGSQGARSIDNAMPELIPLLKELHCSVIHQSRPDAVDGLAESYAKAGISAKVLSFIDDLKAAYVWSDVVLSRSGAGALTELAYVNRPAILVPYPSKRVLQYENAEWLAKKGKALVVNEGENFSARLAAALKEIFKEEKFRAMITLPHALNNADGAEQIAEGCINLLKGAYEEK